MSPPTAAARSAVQILFHPDVPHHLSAEERQLLLAACPRAEFVECYGRPAGAPPVATEGVHILVTDQLVPKDLSAWPALRWVQLLSAGANQLIGTPLARADIPVTTCSGLHGVPIAQFVTGALLSLVHQFPAAARFQAERRWPSDRWALRGTVLRGATAGVIGYGSIGRECARQLHALGMRIVCLDPGARRDDGYNHWPGTGDPEGTLPERWFQPAQLHEFLPRCEVIVVAAPYTPQTAGLIGPAELALTKRGVRIVLISRGGIVDEEALAAGLRDGRVAGAAVDCFSMEPPPPTQPLFDAPHVILTPHVAGAYEGYWTAMIELFAANLRRFEAGKPLLNEPNKQLGY